MRNKISLLLAVAVLLTSVFMTAGTASAGIAVGETLNVGGSTTIFPLITALGPNQPAGTKTLQQAFFDATGIQMSVTEGGSGAGRDGVLNNTLDIGMMSRDLTAAEIQSYPHLTSISIGKDAISIIVNSSSSLTQATPQELINIFVNGNGGYEVCSRLDGSGTLDSFKTLVLGGASVNANAHKFASNEEMCAYINDPANASKNPIGFASLGVENNYTNVKTLNVFNATLNTYVACNTINAKNGSYPFVRNLNLVTKRDAIGNALRFIQFMLGTVAQDRVAAEGYLKINLGNLIVDYVDSDVLPVCQKIKDEIWYQGTIDINFSQVSDAQAIDNVANETAGIAAIKRDLTYDEINNKKLVQYTIGETLSGSNINLVTKNAMRGAEEMFIRYARNPAGQKLAVAGNGFTRLWIFGDVDGNGACTVMDYTYMRQLLLFMRSSFDGPCWLFAADVSGDGVISTADYTYMRQFLLTMISQFPAENTYQRPYYYPKS